MKKFSKKYGDILTAQEYIKNVEEGLFTDYDGNVGELLDEDNNVLEEKYSLTIPSKLNEFKIMLSENTNIKKVVWYNR